MRPSLSARRRISQRFQTLVLKNAETQQNVDHQVALVGQVKASIEADQAAIESAQTQLDYTTIKAPTDGRMGIRQIDPGNIVHAADTTPIVVAHPDKADLRHLHLAGEKSRRRARGHGARRCFGRGL